MLQVPRGPRVAPCRTIRAAAREATALQPQRGHSAMTSSRSKSMKLALARFSSLVFTALALAPSLAHLLELPNKIGLARDDYFVVQQIYRGWALLGVVVYAALFSTLALAVLVRSRGKEFGLALTAFLCIAGTQVIFWTFTHPANQLTANWTLIPENWSVLRVQWEYSHAAAAILNLIAMVAVAGSVLLGTHDRRAVPTGPEFR